MPDYVVEAVKNFSIWRGPEHGEDPGISVLESGYLYLAAFQITSFPDLSLNKDLAKFDFQQRDKIVCGYQQKFLDTLNKIGNERISFSLRYVLHPDNDYESKISLYFIIRMFSEQDDADPFTHILRQVSNIFPTEIGLYHAPAHINNEETIRQIVSVADGMKYVGEIRKKETMFTPFKPYNERIKFIYVPFNYTPQLNTMIPVCETLVKQSGPIVVDINIIPTSLTAYEQHVLKTLVINYDKLQREQKISIEPQSTMADTELVEIPADPVIKLAFDTYKNSLNEYVTSGVFLVSCRVASNNMAAVESVTTVMGRNSTRDFSYEILAPEHEDEWKSSKEALRKCDISIATRDNEIWDRHNAPLAVKRLHRLGGSSEAGAFFRLPIPSIQGVPGFPLSSRPHDTAQEAEKLSWYAKNHERAFATKTINLGNIGLRGSRLEEDLSIALKDLAKHGMIVGVPGSGKTTTCFHILYQLWHLHKIPFLVIEPAKTEYRALKTLKGMENLLVFSLGDENCSPFRFNPFEVLPGISLEKHISNLEACFRGALPLDGPLPFLLSEALEGIYNDRGWQFTHVGAADKTNWPMMIDLYQKLIEVINQKGYKGEVLANVRTALEVRVGGLLRRSVGRMLNTYRSVPAEVLMSRPVVFELDPMNEEQQALMTMFTLNMVKEYVRTSRKSGSGLKHVILLEEAHNLLGHVPATQEQGNPKAEAVKYFTKMLAEMRALGEGIIVADQLPSALHSGVIKNTNLKIMHRLTSEDDRVQLGNSMLLDGEQHTRAVTLTPGESYIYKEGLERPKHVFEPNFKDDFKIAEPPDDDFVKIKMEHFKNESASVFMPFEECALHCRGCNPNIRIVAEKIIQQFSKDAKENQLILQHLKEKNKKCACYYFLKTYLNRPKFYAHLPEKKLPMYCLYVHFLHTMTHMITKGSQITGCRCHGDERTKVFEIFWEVNRNQYKEKQ
ncbi:MAG: ATP-binding protein [Deltaproteobacteria bacterium]|nr:ATP-binding protein [Deltaproteobacteria bacterium]